MPALPALRAAGSRVIRPGRSRVGVPHVPLSAFVVDCGVYVDGTRLEGRWNHRDAIAEVRRREEGFVWIGLHEPDAEQIEDIAEAFGLHPLAVEDAVHAHQRPKIERYDDTLFSVFKTMRYVAHASPTTANEIVESGELMVFLGRDFVVTVRHGQHSGLRRVRHDLVVVDVAGRAEHDEQQVAVALQLGPLVGGDRVLDGEGVQPELLRDGLDLRLARAQQADPAEAVAARRAGPQLLERAVQRVGDLGAAAVHVDRVVDDRHG